MYILSTGCQWRAIPKDLPRRSTLFDYLDLWGYDGTLVLGEVVGDHFGPLIQVRLLDMFHTAG